MMSNDPRLFDDRTVLGITTNGVALPQVAFRDVFDHFPTAVAILSGPDHIVVLMNEPFRRAIGNRPVMGLAVRAAFPGATGRNFHDMLERVYLTDRIVERLEPRGHLDLLDRPAHDLDFFTCTCQPLHDPTGQVNGILLHAVRVLAAASGKGTDDEGNAKVPEWDQSERDSATWSDTGQEILNAAPLNGAGVAPRTDQEFESISERLREANARLIVSGIHQQDLAENAENARSRATFLSEASRFMSLSFDYETTLRNVAGLAVPMLADFCFKALMASKSANANDVGRATGLRGNDLTRALSRVISLGFATKDGKGSSVRYNAIVPPAEILSF